MGRGGRSIGNTGGSLRRSEVDPNAVLPPLRELNPDSWARQPMVTFDLETTGTDPKEDRIVTAAISITYPDGRAEHHSWLVNPGFDMDEETIGIHGITNEAARGGQDSGEAVKEIVEFLSRTTQEGMPIIIYNARFDITMLDAEARRNGIRSLQEDNPFVIDPFVIDKGVNKYRKGSRKLTSVCEHYGLDFPEESAHDAQTDAVFSAELAKQICMRYEEIDIPLPDLVRLQEDWAREQAVSLSEYLTRKHGREITISPEWPLS